MAQQTGSTGSTGSTGRATRRSDGGTRDVRRDGHPPRRLSQRLEEREVVSRDPQFSEETNRRLTEELREAVGAERVRVPVDRPHATAGERMSARSVLTMHRIILAFSLAFLLTVAAILALFTDDWWFLPLAAGVHAAGTMILLILSVRITRDIEHPSPSLAAAMNEEGVVSADHRFSEMVEEFRAPEAEELGQWPNERTVTPQEDPATASVQQSRAMTATSQPSYPAPSADGLDVFMASIGTGFVVVSLIVPLIGGGNWLWLTPAIVIPLCAAMLGMHLISRAKRSVRTWWTSRGGILALWGTTVVAVAVFCVLVALDVHR